jgi:hypothetical protein
MHLNYVKVMRLEYIFALIQAWFRFIYREWKIYREQRTYQSDAPRHSPRTHTSTHVTLLRPGAFLLPVSNDNRVACNRRRGQGGSVRILNIHQLGAGRRDGAARAGTGGVGKGHGTEIRQANLAAVDDQVLHDPLDGGAAQGVRVGHGLGERLARRRVLHGDVARRVGARRGQVDRDGVAGRHGAQVDLDRVAGVPLVPGIVRGGPGRVDGGVNAGLPQATLAVLPCC